MQGEGAKESIVAGIHTLENQNVDVIIVGRGGGSIEDLWAFNEECVAQAIFDCSVPIVTGIGHGSDITISDFVADVSAPTPSAAAELTVFKYSDYIDRLDELSYHMTNEMMSKLAYNKHLVEQKETMIKSLSPSAKLKLIKMTYRQKLDNLNLVIRHKLDSQNQLYDKKITDIKFLMDGRISDDKNKLLILIERFKALSPLDRLEQGYAGVSGDDGKKVRDVSNLKVGDGIHLTMIDGHVDAKVERIRLFDKKSKRIQ